MRTRDADQPAWSTCPHPVASCCCVGFTVSTVARDNFCPKFAFSALSAGEKSRHSHSQNCTLTWLCFLRADDGPTHRRCVHVVHGLCNERNICSNALVEHPNHGTPVARPTIVSAVTAAHVCLFQFGLQQAWAIIVSLFADTSVSPASDWHEVQLNIPKPERPYICWCQCNRQPTYTGDNYLLELHTAA